MEGGGGGGEGTSSTYLSLYISVIRADRSCERCHCVVCDLVVRLIGRHDQEV